MLTLMFYKKDQTLKGQTLDLPSRRRAFGIVVQRFILIAVYVTTGICQFDDQLGLHSSQFLI